MGLQCKPIGKLESITRKMENKLSKERASNKERVERAKAKRK